MNQISVAEKNYIRDGFKLKVRSDGRANTDVREIWLQTGTLKQANGSCTLYDPDASSTVHIGIKVIFHYVIENIMMLYSSKLANQLRKDQKKELSVSLWIHHREDLLKELIKENLMRYMRI